MTLTLVLTITKFYTVYSQPKFLRVMFCEFMLFLGAISLIGALDDDNDWRPLVISVLIYLPFLLLVNFRLIMINFQSTAFFEFSNIFESFFRLDQGLFKIPNRKVMPIERQQTGKKSQIIQSFTTYESQMISTQRQRVTNETKVPDN